MTEEERLQAEILRAFVGVFEESDYYWCFASHALKRQPTPADRKAIKALRQAGLLKLYSGGFNEDGGICGGSGYRHTSAGIVWLQALEAQAELAL